MEAPEKIYLEKVYPDNGVLPNGLNYYPSPSDIEYTRTDAFIKKACDWIEDHVYDYLKMNRTWNEPDYEPKLIEDFRKAMKGE